MRYSKKIKYLIMMLIFISFSYSIEFDIDSDCRLGYLAGKKLFAPKAGFTFGGFSIK